MKARLLIASTLPFSLVLTSTLVAGSQTSRPRAGAVEGAQRHILAVKYLDNRDTSVDMAGTAIDRRARGKADVKFEHGRTRIKLDMHGLGHPQALGPFYTTFVLWAIAPEGQVSNVAELPIKQEFRIDATTPFQTFGLVVTAEPHAAVKLPSPVIVAENVAGKRTEGVIESSRLEYRGDPGTFYTTASATTPPLKADFRTPLPVLGARRAVEIARRAGARQFAEAELREAEAKLAALEQVWPAGGDRDRYERRFGGMARDVMRLAEHARTLSVERAAQADLKAEREAATNTIAYAQDAAAFARDAMIRAQQEAQEARDHVAQAQTEAEKARANEELARAEAEQSRIEALAARGEASQAQTEAEWAKTGEAQARNEAEQSRERADQAMRERDALQQRLYASISEVLETRREARGLIVNLSDVLFDFDRATLKPGAREKLSKLAGILLAYPGRYHIEIEGHTDSIGSDDYNLRLSQDRAESVRGCLAEAGITPDRILATRGLGKAGPVASNETAAGRELNRRVELVIQDVSPAAS